MATHTPVVPLRAANPVTFAAADGMGDDFVNTGKELAVVEHTNPGGAAVTLTVTTTATVDTEAVADKVIVIGVGETHVLGRGRSSGTTTPTPRCSSRGPR